MKIQLMFTDNDTAHVHCLSPRKPDKEKLRSATERLLRMSCDYLWTHGGLKPDEGVSFLGFGDDRASGTQVEVPHHLGAFLLLKWLNNADVMQAFLSGGLCLSGEFSPEEG